MKIILFLRKRTFFSLFLVLLSQANACNSPVSAFILRFFFLDFWIKLLDSDDCRVVILLGFYDGLIRFLYCLTYSPTFKLGIITLISLELISIIFLMTCFLSLDSHYISILIYLHTSDLSVIIVFFHTFFFIFNKKYCIISIFHYAIRPKSVPFAEYLMTFNKETVFCKKVMSCVVT